MDSHRISRRRDFEKHYGRLRYGTTENLWYKITTHQRHGFVEYLSPPWRNSRIFSYVREKPKGEYQHLVEKYNLWTSCKHFKFCSIQILIWILFRHLNPGHEARNVRYFRDIALCLDARVAQGTDLTMLWLLCSLFPIRIASCHIFLSEKEEKTVCKSVQPFFLFFLKGELFW